MSATSGRAGVARSEPTPRQLEREAAIVPQLKADMAERWPAYYPNRANGAAPSITCTPRACGYSAIFKIDLDFDDGAARESCIIKIRREHKHGSFDRRDVSERTIALTRAEYDEHLKAYRYFSGNGDGLSVVRPLDYLEERNALVIEYATGRDLSKLVKSGDAVASEALRRCGAWWRLFHHDLHRAQLRAWEPSVVNRGLDQRLARLRKFGAPDDLLATLKEEIRSTASRFAETEAPVSLIHGDCKLRHVWASPLGIQVIDFGNTKPGDSWADPAALVVELCLFSLWTSRLDAAPRAADIRTLTHAYFNGAPPPAFGLYVVDCLLKKWHRRLRNWGPGAGLRRIRRSLQSARLDKPLERLYIDRWFTAQVRAWLAFAEGNTPRWLQAVSD